MTLSIQENEKGERQVFLGDFLAICDESDFETGLRALHACKGDDITDEVFFDLVVELHELCE